MGGNGKWLIIYGIIGLIRVGSWFSIVRWISWWWIGWWVSLFRVFGYCYRKY